MHPAPVSNSPGFSRAVQIASATLHPLRAAGGVSPSMALGSMPTRPALLIRVIDTQGCAGWGEVWANFPPRANLHKAHLIEDVILPKLAGIRFVEPREAVEELRTALCVYFLHIGQRHVFEHVLAGLDMALWDLALRSAGRSFAQHLQIPPRARCYASSLNRDDLEPKLTAHHAMGQRHFKLKLGFDDAGDADFVDRAARACPENARLMVDSNQKWDIDRAERMLDRLAGHGLQFAEEPIPANAPLQDWARLARTSEIPLGAGENIYGLDAFCAMAEAGVRYLQPDVAKWGGVTGALDLAQALPGDTYLWPHFMGTALGQVAALSVAAAIGPTSVCEMDVNANPLRTELCGDVLRTEAGQIALPQVPGLVPPPTSDALRRYEEPL